MMQDCGCRPIGRFCGHRREAISRNRNGSRWMLWGLPGGYTTVRRIGDLLDPARFRNAVPLIQFRAPYNPYTTSNFDRVRAARDAAFRYFTV